MTEPAKPTGRPSEAGSQPTDEEAIRTAVAALAARLSPSGPPAKGPAEDSPVASASAAGTPAGGEAAATVVPGRVAAAPAPVEAPKPAKVATAAMPVAAAPRVAPLRGADRPAMLPAAPRRSPGRVVLILLLLLLLLLGGVGWLLRDHPQVAALLGRAGPPALEPKQAAAPTQPVTSPPTAPAKPDMQQPAPPAAAPSSATAPAPEPAKPDGPPPATAAAAPAEPPQTASPPAATEPARTEPARTEPTRTEPARTEPAKTDPALAPPTFDNVLVRDGRAVISGRAPAGSRVEVLVGGRAVATTQADARGEWVAILDVPLPPGSHELRLVQTQPGGTPVPSDRTVAVLIPMPAEPPPPAAAAPTTPAPPPPADTAKPDAPPASGGPPPPSAATTPPSAPSAATTPASMPPLVVATPTAPGGVSQVLQGPPLARAGDLELGSVDYDSVGRMTIGGRASPGETVRVYLNNQRVGDATAGADGKWTLAPGRAVPHGQQRLRVDRLTTGGAGVAHRLELPFERVTVKPGEAVTIVRGDNLWSIARGALGSGERYTAIYEANRNQIRDPNLIYPGQVFVIPTPR